MNVTAVKSPNPIVVISVKQYHNASWYVGIPSSTSLRTNEKARISNSSQNRISVA